MPCDNQEEVQKAIERRKEKKFYDFFVMSFEYSMLDISVETPENLERENLEH